MILPPSPEAFARAAEVLRAGGVVAHPTETVYGLAVDPFSDAALQRLFAVKGRPDTNPVLVIVADTAQLEALTGPLPTEARALADAFWPGPLSLVLPEGPSLPTLLTAGTGRICARCPAHDAARALAAAFGGPVTSTSANRTGQPPALTAADALLHGVDLALDGGPLAPSRPSTIYDIQARKVLREGPISSPQIEAVLTRIAH